jgi:phosphate starvation-inducible PhoH-like protein
MKKESTQNKGDLYFPKTENQKKYVSFLENQKNHLLVVTGPAGTGKTLFACTTAIKYLKNGLIDKIIITRPIVPVEEEELGFLPGDIKKKMDPWTRPIFDILLEHFSQKELDSMVQQKSIEISPLAFMRGRTFKRSFIIADEMQNSTPIQMKMLATRMGKDSKMVITGDISQTDLIYKKRNGLSDLMERINSINTPNFNDSMIKLIQLNSTDIERSELVVRVIDLYDDVKHNSFSNSINISDKINKTATHYHSLNLNTSYEPHFNVSSNTSFSNITTLETKNKTDSIISTIIDNPKNISNIEIKQIKVKKPGYNYKKRDNDAALIPLGDETIVKKYWWDYP